MFTFITSLLSRSCNIPGLISRKILDGICENDISATLLDNPLSILPNSLKKKQLLASRTETDQASAVLSDPVCGPLLGQPQETNTIKMIKKEMKSNENGTVSAQSTQHFSLYICISG